MHYHQRHYLPRLLLFLMATLSLASCKEVTVDDIEIKKGVACLKGSLNPYSGPIKEYFKNPDGTNNKLMLEGIYSKGLKTEVWTTYGWDGEKSTVKYEAGLEEGTAEEFLPDGRIKRSIAYSKGRRNGISVDYDAKGTKLHQLFYLNGFIVPPPIPRKGEPHKEGEEVETHDEPFGKKHITITDYIKGLF